jgi:NADH-quinone oxidoreductase subunit L
MQIHMQEVATLATATGVPSMAWLLIALPALGAAVLLLGGKRTNAWGHYFAVLMAVGSFVVGAIMLTDMLGRAPEARGVVIPLWDWLVVGGFKVPVALQLDQLSLSFVLLITSVGSLIHIYSLGYMEHDANRRKFFAYLNLFFAAMLTLVLANNYLLLYVGWEGVGLASYLLIGFWQHKPSAATAAKKAFVVNRVGDLGLSLAIMLMFTAIGSVTFAGVNAGAPKLEGQNVLTWIGLALLLAACGKSAQFPLQSWLLDAMEGPTPVSALIHAATMVTAGVYLIARSHAIFDIAPTAQLAVIIVGGITLIMGAVIGTAKDDIKKGLAGSTMSQIGYMILGVGLGPVGYVFALFHLITHGFFKAGMFLGAGSVMHGMRDNVNMRRYGALRKSMVITYATFGMGYLAILGIPPFAGFWSKDEIIKAAFDRSFFVGLITLVGAGITAFYMTRMMAMTFFGTARWDDDVHPHESPLTMTIPMMILAVGSAFGGMVLLFVGDIESWLEPVVGFKEAVNAPSAAVLMPTTILVVLAGAYIGFRKYALQPVPVEAPANVTFATRAARADLYGDAFNETVFMRPGQWLTRTLVFFDRKVVDGAVNGTAGLIGLFAAALRRIQNGYVRSYALTMLIGVTLVLAAAMLVRMS